MSKPGSLSVSGNVLVEILTWREMPSCFVASSGGERVVEPRLMDCPALSRCVLSTYPSAQSLVIHDPVNDEKWRFLTLRSVPARLSVREAAWLLGFNDNDVTVLMAAGLLKPLGRPRPSGSKFFAATDIVRLREDPLWLAKASDAVVRYWRQKNAGRRHGNVGNGTVETPRLFSSC